ncbi:hypothetical protein BDQ94DRAFT_137351 [Aspergillus welwitschiae]|uniref:Uncharacterized protein n=1 Tax=Aspergillus welwitschiae TaxID=1341132 RepID=A0A3F3QCV6_9EURO|nr:hypothetical protein BDQ94DRAFT_137351 [Aspergillus welwitschiae]RDH37041.1 hypothetical protein BDQ94DRAFT_137351 [Aspergillus welwitschiae]
MRAGLVYLPFTFCLLAAFESGETSWWSWVFRCCFLRKLCSSIHCSSKCARCGVCAGLAIHTGDFCFFLLCYLFCLVGMVGLCFSRVLTSILIYWNGGVAGY